MNETNYNLLPKEIGWCKKTRMIQVMIDAELKRYRMAMSVDNCYNRVEATTMSCLNFITNTSCIASSKLLDKQLQKLLGLYHQTLL